MSNKRVKIKNNLENNSKDFVNSRIKKKTTEYSNKVKCYILRLINISIQLVRQYAYLYLVV